MPNFHTISLTAHSVPEFKEYCKPGNRWVMAGTDDKYPNYLNKLYERSSVQKTLVNGKADYIYGKNGFSSENARVSSFIENCNRDDEGLNTVFERCAIDEELFGGYYLNVIWNNIGSAVAEVYHVPFLWMRSDELNTKFFFTEKFSCEKRVPFSDKSVVEYDAFNVNSPKGSQILFVKNYTPNVKTYCLPDYSGANPAIETNIEINNYHLNNIKNGFSGGFLINFKNGEPTPEDEKKIYKSIEDQHTGSDSAGRFVLVFSEGPSDAPDIVPLTPNDLDKVFEQLRKDTNEEIFIGHRVISPMLFGIKTEGQLGGATEIQNAFQIFQNTVISKKQERFIKVFSDLVGLATGVNETLELTSVPPIKEVIPISSVLTDLTQDERRELVGYKPIAQQEPATFSRHRKDKEKDKADFEVFNEFGRVMSDEELAGYTERDLEFIEDVPVLYHFDKLTDISKKAISIIKEEPNITIDRLGEALDLQGNELIDLVKGLKTDKLAWVNKAGGVKITEKGESVVENLDLPEYEVVYRYEKSPSAPGPSILPNGRTRDFCELMVRAKKVYTRQEIDTISERLSYNVWQFRGGWTTTPGGDHVPYCRHIWRQYVVKKK